MAWPLNWDSEGVLCMQRQRLGFCNDYGLVAKQLFYKFIFKKLIQSFKTEAFTPNYTLCPYHQNFFSRPLVFLEHDIFEG